MRAQTVRPHPAKLGYPPGIHTPASVPTSGATSGACTGYAVDHIVPLKHGGADTPANMRWQKGEDAKAKDRVE